MNSKHRRVAFCITDLDAGGAERCLATLASGLKRRGWEPHVYCLSAGGALVDRLVEANVPVTCLGMRSWRNIGTVVTLARQLRAQRPALLQTFLFHANLVGRLAAVMAGVPVVVSGVRVAERERRWHLSLDRITQWAVTMNVCVSRAVANFSQTAGGIPREKLAVIPNCVDVDRFRNASPADLSEFGIGPGERTLLAVGRLHRQKGHRLLLEAAAPLLDRDPHLHVLIAGEGPLRAALQESIAAASWGPQVHLLGPREDIPQLMRAATLFVLPSLWEGMPNVLLEAMAAGVPAVASDVEGVRELLAPAGEKLIVPPGSAESLRSGIETVLSDPASARKIAHDLQVISQERFARSSLLDSYAGLYNELLKNRGLLNS
ncbi:MAG: glycosyltransferase [Planctomycetota bacterium]|nr:MAG: glycosyltransferase [Planctomycetota bacterium]REJ95332.1 MAG: glycosyltransferase [Planctomycetota bacterium]REK24226.1 MAG: glycosyltransferase [Planctomycetota bacterium]REK28788.1 MAG: glycosyltransferase [Planctomycetota bacterium]